MNLSEKWRPKDWSQVVGMDSVVKSLLALRERNGGHFGGLVFYITGQSGTGKTTLAKLIAGSICEKTDYVTSAAMARVVESSPEHSQRELFPCS